MIKFKTIQTKIKLNYFRLIGKISKINDVVEIKNKDNKRIKNILIIFPINESSFRVALYSFRNLIKNNNVNYFFLVNHVYKHHFHLKGYVFDIFYNNKKDKVKFDETFYETTIINKKFDMIIDLNDKFFYDVCFLINNLNSYYKIGFKKSYSDYFYNIQFNVSKNDVLENGYKKIQLMLG